MYDSRPVCKLSIVIRGYSETVNKMCVKLEVHDKNIGSILCAKLPYSPKNDMLVKYEYVLCTI